MYYSRPQPIEEQGELDDRLPHIKTCVSKKLLTWQWAEAILRGAVRACQAIV